MRVKKTLAVTKAQESTRAEYEKMLEQLKGADKSKRKAYRTAYRSDQIYDHRKKNLPYQWLWRKQDRNSTAKKDKLRQEISQRDMQIQQLNSEHTLQMQKVRK